jgi:hypothetical protein
MKIKTSVFIMKYIFLLLCAFVVITSGLSPAILSAQDSNVQRNNWLLGVLFKLERMRDSAVADIRKCGQEIQKSESTIRKSEDILMQARQKGNVQAENIALQALTKAQEAKRTNEKNKSMAELKKRKTDLAIANIRNLVAKQSSINSEIRSVVTNHTGRVEINRLGETISLDDNRAGYLEPGDTIRTYGNSSAEMQFLDGRGTLKIGPYSQFKMEEDSSGTQIVNMLKGKMHIAVEKMDEYQKEMEENIRAYREDLQTVEDEAKRELVKAYYGLKGKSKKFEVRTPMRVIAIRATEFLVFEDDMKGTELIVLEGSVEMKGTKGEKTIIVNAGHRAICTKEGTCSGPEKIDLTTMHKWWEE